MEADGDRRRRTSCAGSSYKGTDISEVDCIYTFSRPYPAWTADAVSNLSARALLISAGPKAKDPYASDRATETLAD